MAQAWFNIVHQSFDLLRLIGMRDRLRCPKCKSIGTYKPHGGWLDIGDTVDRRRWLCKWCGFFLSVKYVYGEVEVQWCGVGEVSWSLYDSRDLVPQNIIEAKCTKVGRIGTINPWRG